MERRRYPHHTCEIFSQNFFGETISLEIVDIPLALITERGHGFEGKNIQEEMDYYSGIFSGMMTTEECDPICLEYVAHEGVYIIHDGWHRYQLANILEWETIRAVVVNEYTMKRVWKEMKKCGWIRE